MELAIYQTTTSEYDLYEAGRWNAWKGINMLTNIWFDRLEPDIIVFVEKRV